MTRRQSGNLDSLMRSGQVYCSIYDWEDKNRVCCFAIKMMGSIWPQKKKCEKQKWGVGRGTQQNQGGVRKKREGAAFIQNKLFCLWLEKKEQKKSSLLTSRTQCQNQSVSAEPALLVSQTPAHNGGQPGQPHLSLPIWILRDRPESRGERGGQQCPSRVQILIE